MINRFILAGISMLALPSLAKAECAAAIQSIGAVPVVQYEPFSNQAATATLTVDLLLAEDATDCSLGLAVFGLEIGAGRTAKLNGAELIYRLFNDGKELSNDSSSPVSFMTKGGDRVRVSLRIEVPAGQLALAGTYVDPISVRLVDTGAGNAPLGADVSAVITVAMNSRAQINLAGGSVSPAGFGFARLAFGTLKQNQFRTAQLQLRSTAPVTLTIASENGSKLQRLGGKEMLAYDLLLGGTRLMISGGPATLVRDASPSRMGANYSLEVSISGNPELLPAGEYRDLLTINVDPN